jgi:hypothetical protein
VPLEVIRGGAQLAAHRRQAAAHPVPGQVAADPDDHVEALLRQVHGAVGDGHVDVDLRIPGEEFRQGRRHVQGAEGHRGRHLEHAARLAVQAGHHPLGPLRLVQDANAVFREGGAHLRGTHVAGAAVEQARAQGFFQPGHRLAHRRAGGAQAPRRLGEATGFADLGEQGHEIEILHEQHCSHSGTSLMPCAGLLPPTARPYHAIKRMPHGRRNHH